MRALNRIFKGRRSSQLLPLVAKIRALFANGEQGWWYDPSNMSTLFQDAAGTTPVTAMEQPVGLQLDLSKGLVLGPEKIVNGDGTTLNGWTNSPSSWWTISGGRFYHASSSSYNELGQTFTTISNSAVIQFDAQVLSAAGSAQWFYTNAAGTIRTPSSGDMAFLSSGNSTVKFIAKDGIQKIGFARSSGSTAEFYIDNITVRELPGNHRFQSTSANRPVVSARVNLLTSTAFTGAIAGTPGTAPTDWSFNSIGGSITSVSGGVISFSVTGARQIIGQTVTLPANAQQVWRVVVESNPNSLTFNQLFTVVNSTGATRQDFANGVSVDNALYVPVAGTVLSSVLTNGATQITPIFRIGVGASGVVTGSASFSKVDARVTNDGVGLPAYQRVNTSTDYDTVGFPVYIKPNGSNQFMQTNSINFSATDKMTLWQGVRKLSDAAEAMITELSANVDSNNGTFSIFAPGGISAVRDSAYVGVSKGTIKAFAGPLAAAYPAPITNVVTTANNISGDSVVVRINGAQVTQSTADQGTGNYGNYPAYFYARGGTSLFFNGHDYGSIARGAASTAAQIAAGETYMNSKTKAY